MGKQQLKNALNTQGEKLKQYSEYYNNLMLQYKEIKAYSAHLEEQIHEYEEKVKNMISMDDFTYESVKAEKYEQNRDEFNSKSVSKCFKFIPIIYQKSRKTSLETWIAKLENYIISDKKEKKHLQTAISTLENCRKGLEGENILKSNLLELGSKNVNFKDMVILQDLYFKSPFEADDGFRKNIQIDFLVITRFVIFIFDSKYRTGVEKIDIDNKISHNMQGYRSVIMEILSQNGLKEKFNIKNGNIYAIMVYSGKNEIDHAGFHVKSTDSNGECDISYSRCRFNIYRNCWHCIKYSFDY